MNIISAIRTRLAIWGLKSKNYKRREKAIKILAQIGVDSTEALINFINSRYRYKPPKKFAAVFAVKALGLIGDNRAVAPLSALIKDPWDEMRTQVIIALGKINHKDAVLPLIEALEYDQTRSYAIEALQKINDPRASEPLQFAKHIALIQKLSLKPTGLSLIHPDKEKAMDEIKSLGQIALNPLLFALERSDEAARGTIIYLLSCIGDNKTVLLPIAKRLMDNSSTVRYEAICALEKFSIGYKSDPEVVILLKQATTGGDIEVRKKSKQLLAKIGIQTTEMLWSTGAETWKQIADAFVMLEVTKPSPDFKGLGEKLQKFSTAERHGAWAYIAGKLDRIDKTKSMRCYIEALYNDPDPNSVAWGWLNGQYDKEMNILSLNSPKTIGIIEELRNKYVPIIKE